MSISMLPKKELIRSDDDPMHLWVYYEAEQTHQGFERLYRQHAKCRCDAECERKRWMSRARVGLFASGILFALGIWHMSFNMPQMGLLISVMAILGMVASMRARVRMQAAKRLAIQSQLELERITPLLEDSSHELEMARQRALFGALLGYVARAFRKESKDPVMRLDHYLRHRFHILMDDERVVHPLEGHQIEHVMLKILKEISDIVGWDLESHEVIHKEHVHRWKAFDLGLTQDAMKHIRGLIKLSEMESDVRKERPDEGAQPPADPPDCNHHSSE